MTRQEHLDWCKKRALEYVEIGQMQNALNSFLSDLTKHPETEDTAMLARQMGAPLLFGGHLSTAHQMREWINGFN